MSKMRPPHDPDLFRQQVGRYGDRHYVDQLPACRLHTPARPPATLPSVSVLKGAWPKFLTAWAGQEAAKYAVVNKAAWEQLEPDEAVSLIAKASDRTKNRAASRGSEIHDIIENLSFGRQPDMNFVSDAVMPYIGVIQQIVRDLNIKPVISEAVVFNHTIGYGGTFDMIADTVHGRLMLDWKTRKNTSAYPEEACQGAAYTGAEYMIVEEDGEAVRRELPEFDAIAICVMAPDGYKLHEVNEQKAWDAFTAMVAFWHAKSGSMYDGILPTKHVPVVDEENLRERIVALSPGARKYLAQIWPQNLPTLKQQPTVSDMLQIERMLSDVEARDEATFNYPQPPDEGGMMDKDIYEHIREVYETLPWETKDVVDDILKSNDVTIGKHSRTNRRFEILRMVIYAVQLGENDAENSLEFLPEHLARCTMEEAKATANELRERLDVSEMQSS